MAGPKHQPVAGGIFIAVGLLGGAVAGIAAGEPSLGMVTGLCAGIAAALLLWLRDRRR